MVIDVELFGQLALSLPQRQDLTLESEVTVGEVAILLGIKPAEIGLVTIDGVQSYMHTVVPLTCRLCFFPPMSGG